jgi:hypothetical protein
MFTCLNIYFSNFARFYHIWQQELHIWKGKRSLALANKSLTCFQYHKGIHKGMIVSISLTHMSTLRLENCTRNVSDLHVPLIFYEIVDITKGNAKVFETPCGNGVWHIKWCPLTSHVQCSSLQNNTNYFCIARIFITKLTTIGVPNPLVEKMSFWTQIVGILTSFNYISWQRQVEKHMFFY